MQKRKRNGRGVVAVVAISAVLVSVLVGQIGMASGDQVKVVPDGCLIHVYNPPTVEWNGQVGASAQLSCKSAQRLRVKVVLWERNTNKHIWQRAGAESKSRHYVVVDAGATAKCHVGRTTLYGVSAEAEVNGKKAVRIPIEFATKQKVACRNE